MHVAIDHQRLALLGDHLALDQLGRKLIRPHHRRAGIGRVAVIDAAADARHAGIWENGARMHVLRTPKTLAGPELGIAALSFQAWYEARHGQDAYAAIDRIKRTDWAEYLSWYKRFLSVNPRYETRLERIEAALQGGLSVGAIVLGYPHRFFIARRKRSR